MPVNKRNWRNKQSILLWGRGPSRWLIIRILSGLVARRLSRLRMSVVASTEPGGRKADCHRDTGLDPKTILSSGGIAHLRLRVQDEE